MIPETLADADLKMGKCVEALKRDLGGVRTGRATPALVEHLVVDYYDTPTPLKQLASISIPESRLIVIQPWDRTAMQAIEKAILKSDVGMTPSNDGQVIRLSVPPLTEERRKEMVKLMHKRVEEARNGVRNVRTHALDALRKMESQKQFSQDDLKRASDQVQKLHDRHILIMEDLRQTKEAEVMHV
ncbi:MAG: ribosome recycling factor [Dehalococcoidia bacterium]|nr:ribosome recycling factor [Dehalococcoidia bacterium]